MPFIISLIAIAAALGVVAWMWAFPFDGPWGKLGQFILSIMIIAPLLIVAFTAALIGAINNEKYRWGYAVLAGILLAPTSYLTFFLVRMFTK